MFNSGPLEKRIVEELVEAAIAEQSMRMAEDLRGLQKHSKIYGRKALLRSVMHFAFCRHRSFYPIE